MRKDYNYYKKTLCAKIVPLELEREESCFSPGFSPTLKPFEEEAAVIKNVFHDADETKTFYELVKSNTKTPSKEV